VSNRSTTPRGTRQPSSPAFRDDDSGRRNPVPVCDENGALITLAEIFSFESRRPATPAAPRGPALRACG